MFVSSFGSVIAGLIAFFIVMVIGYILVKMFIR